MTAVEAGPEEADERLIARVGRGDRAAFAHLVHRHRPRVTAVANRMLADPAAAEDVVQETFLRAWVKAPGWIATSAGGTARFTTWLSRIAVNLAIDRLRRRPDLPLDDTPEPPDPAAGAEDILLAREQDARLERAVAALPERQRAAIALTYDQELSNAEGAAALGTTLGAFELLLVRARRTLRTTMTCQTEIAG